MTDLVRVLMERDGVTEQEAIVMVRECRDDRDERIAEGDFPCDILQEFFGLEPDYLFDLDMI